MALGGDIRTAPVYEPSQTLGYLLKGSPFDEEIHAWAVTMEAARLQPGPQPVEPQSDGRAEEAKDVLAAPPASDQDGRENDAGVLARKDPDADHRPSPAQQSVADTKPAGGQLTIAEATAKANETHENAAATAIGTAQQNGNAAPPVSATENAVTEAHAAAIAQCPAKTDASTSNEAATAPATITPATVTDATPLPTATTPRTLTKSKTMDKSVIAHPRKTSGSQPSSPRTARHPPTTAPTPASKFLARKPSLAAVRDAAVRKAAVPADKTAKTTTYKASTTSGSGSASNPTTATGPSGQRTARSVPGRHHTSAGAGTTANTPGTARTATTHLRTKASAPNVASGAGSAKHDPPLRNVRSSLSSHDGRHGRLSLSGHAPTAVPAHGAPAQTAAAAAATTTGTRASAATAGPTRGTSARRSPHPAGGHHGASSAASNHAVRAEHSQSQSHSRVSSPAHRLAHDKSFLARMTRPTASSASKIHEKHDQATASAATSSATATTMVGAAAAHRPRSAKSKSPTRGVRHAAPGSTGGAGPMRRRVSATPSTGAAVRVVEKERREAMKQKSQESIKAEAVPGENAESAVHSSKTPVIETGDAGSGQVAAEARAHAVQDNEAAHAATLAAAQELKSSPAQEQEQELKEEIQGEREQQQEKEKDEGHEKAVPPATEAVSEKEAPPAKAVEGSTPLAEPN
ncbi:hypothetical protein KEM52_006075 [Ascosphaera acerosa]|nr:hypothetical protein KEM52_006075 [Ascosphaera acerosa]